VGIGVSLIVEVDVGVGLFLIIKAAVGTTPSLSFVTLPGFENVEPVGVIGLLVVVVSLILMVGIGVTVGIGDIPEAVESLSLLGILFPRLSMTLSI
jgi:hypothetical protein